MRLGGRNDGGGTRLRHAGRATQRVAPTRTPGWGTVPAFAGTTVVLSGGGFTGRRSTVLRQAQSSPSGDLCVTQWRRGEDPSPRPSGWGTVPGAGILPSQERRLWRGSSGWRTVPAFAGTTVVVSGGGFTGRRSTVLRQAQDERVGAPAPPTPLWVGDGSWGRNPAFAGTTIVLPSGPSAGLTSGSSESSERPSPPLWVGDGSWGRNPAFAGTTTTPATRAQA